MRPEIEAGNLLATSLRYEVNDFACLNLSLHCHPDSTHSGELPCVAPFVGG